MKQKSVIIKKPKKPNITLRRKVTIAWARFVFAIKLSILVLLGVLFFTNYFNSFKQAIAQHVYEFTGDIGFRLENVHIEGQHNTRPEDVLATLNADKGTPILSVDIKDVKEQLEKNPWIKAVAVERQLPATLYIAILERAPVAIWQINGKLYLIDEDGFNITAKNIENFAYLPHVVGIDANIYAVKLIEDLKYDTAIAKKMVSAVRYGERRWNLNLEENITVKMPEKNFEAALKYLSDLNKVSKLFGQNYKIIDLRDLTKYYIEKY
jgi:cell division protein FtsQ